LQTSLLTSVKKTFEVVTKDRIIDITRNQFSPQFKTYLIPSATGLGLTIFDFLTSIPFRCIFNVNVGNANG